MIKESETHMRKLLSTLSVITIAILMLGACSTKETLSSAESGETVASPERKESKAENLSEEGETDTSLALEEDLAKEPEEGAAVVTHIPRVEVSGSTFTGNEPLEIIEFFVSDPENEEGLSTEKKSFGFGAAKDGAPNQITVDNQAYFDSLQVGALAWDNRTEGKKLYLTFDCGYEYENLTVDILNVLKEKEVTATFFCTLDYLQTAPEIVARMIDDGHIVGNHASTHPDCSALSREELAWEILGVDNYLRANFGYTSPYFRFPSGEYSENAMDLVHDLGYKNVFWSLAYADWDPKNQPGVSKSLQTITERLHPGAVILLHSTSPDNAVIMGDFIDYARNQGYEFVSLDEYPWE